MTRSACPGLATAAAIFLPGLPVAAWACGSMGLNEPRVANTLFAAIFLPMLVLIPVEMAFLRGVGHVERFFVAYLACLPGKVASIYLVAWTSEAKLIQGIVAAELTYSLGLFLISLPVLAFGFRARGMPLVLSSILISTVIPWLYSLALWLIARTVIH